MLSGVTSFVSRHYDQANIALTTTGVLSL